MDKQDHRQQFARSYLDRLSSVLQALPLEDLARALERLEEAHRQGSRVFIAGNGGSAATASHMANDLLKGVGVDGRRGFRATALSDNVPLITAIANDISYSEVFSAQLEVLGEAGDVLIVLSGSGNSPNVVRAVETAKRMRMSSIAFLGMGGGNLAAMVDVGVVVPSNDYGPIEIIHLLFDHLAMTYFRGKLQGQPPGKAL